MIDGFAEYLVAECGFSSTVVSLLRWGLCALYYFWQGVVLAGWWCLAHEAGHGSLSNYAFVNHFIGFSLRTVSDGHWQLGRLLCVSKEISLMRI